MAGKTPNDRQVWQLVRRQHGTIARWQLCDFGYSQKAIDHRLATGRLHRTPFRAVYAVGRPELSELGKWMAAVLACGKGAVLSHQSAAALWEIRAAPAWPVHVISRGWARSRRGILVAHRWTG